MENLAQSYKPELYEKIKHNGYNYAKIIIPELKKIIPEMNTVLDVGCGAGSFLSGCFELGMQITGVDGAHVTQSLQVDPNYFKVADLEKPLDLGHQYDLCVSMEVAEHLDDRFSDIFIDSICRHSKNILFSAAQVGQPGIHHVNCQPLEYWQGKFAARGYAYLPEISEWIRHNRNIYHWYRKNSMVFRSA